MAFTSGDSDLLKIALTIGDLTSGDAFNPTSSLKERGLERRPTAGEPDSLT